jgi:threonine/homoserine/homoserine lactone efflux protein
VVEFLLAVLPSAGVLFLFYLGIKALVEADRREGATQDRIERAAGPGDDGGPSAP